VVPKIFHAQGSAGRSRRRCCKPAVVASAGVSMYLTREAIAATLHQVAALTTRSTLAMTFLQPLELAAPEARTGLQMAEKGGRSSVDKPWWSAGLQNGWQSLWWDS
jgi:O-methyltransferase involved in polyketide biosynthesis